MDQDGLVNAVREDNNLVGEESEAERDQKIKQILQAHAAKPVTAFMANKLINEAAKHWDLFYKRNTTNFFKDRHWTFREFEELSAGGGEVSRKKLLEVGCGVGNFIWPLIEQNPEIFVYACDFSPRAVNFVKENENYNESRVKAFVCDLTKDKLVDNVPAAHLDVVSCIFVLSAIPPAKLADAVKNIAEVVRVGGKVIFRDYAVHDEAELRFKPGHMISEHFYMRQLSKLFEEAGFVTEENYYVKKDVENRKRELRMERIWIQARFRKT
ncbi:hypothetical protein HDU76_007089 [Blyttiomyces sp. JEL0837]|nr:hypothetical protein HDU76_007089 [Blyttiomyces sp. JEL0837]